MSTNSIGGRSFLKPLSDQELEDLLRTSLRKDSRVDEQEVQVHVDRGMIYLSGSVDSAAERQAVEEDIISVTDSRKIIDDLELRNYVARSNEELSAEVRQALGRNMGNHGLSIAVEAEDGEVTLSGTVPNYAQKMAADNVAWWTPGVTRVISCLQVSTTAEMEP